jgi:hypothetical protein
LFDAWSVFSAGEESGARTPPRLEQFCLFWSVLVEWSFGLAMSDVPEVPDDVSELLAAKWLKRTLRDYASAALRAAGFAAERLNSPLRAASWRPHSF